MNAKICAFKVTGKYYKMASIGKSDSSYIVLIIHFKLILQIFFS